MTTGARYYQGTGCEYINPDRQTCNDKQHIIDDCWKQIREMHAKWNEIKKENDAVRAKRYENCIYNHLDTIRREKESIKILSGARQH